MTTNQQPQPNSLTSTNTSTTKPTISIPPTSRSRERPTGDEEADTTLHLGEFSQTPSLSLSEARHIINAVIEARRANPSSQNPSQNNPSQTLQQLNETETLVKTQDYLDMFARFKQKENIEAVERLLTSYGQLASFERSQLGSLCCSDSDEAKTLIPSLVGKIGDGELDELTREITGLRNFVEGS